jgi:hypothetical protein
MFYRKSALGQTTTPKQFAFPLGFLLKISLGTAAWEFDRESARDE